MLGDLVVEERGKITSQRILGTEPPRIEISYSSIKKIRGVEGTGTVTYRSILKPDGTLYGEGGGMLMSRDGQEMATFTGQGIGRFVGPGKVRFIGSVFYNTASTGRLAFLKNLLAVFEHEVDESGNVSTREWEWK